MRGTEPYSAESAASVGRGLAKGLFCYQYVGPWWKRKLSCRPACEHLVTIGLNRGQFVGHKLLRCQYICILLSLNYISKKLTLYYVFNK